MELRNTVYLLHRLLGRQNGIRIPRSGRISLFITSNALSQPWQNSRTRPSPIHFRPFSNNPKSRNTKTLSEAATVDESLVEAQSLANNILKYPSVPSEETVMSALRAIETAAHYLVNLNEQYDHKTRNQNTPTSAILSLDANTPIQSRPIINTSTPLRRTIDSLSTLAYSLLKHPSVFINTPILTHYVTIQSLLTRPESFPEIFDLYATKPIAIPSRTSNPHKPRYKSPSPKALASAIPPSIIDPALASALRIRSLPLAISIIDTSYRAPAYKRAKAFRQAMLPALAAVLTPAAAWTLAAQLATQQTGLTPEAFTQIAFAGIFTYVACVGTIGYVALTTSNDQMRRVTWAVGMPLAERWLREEERAALDRVALHFGFRDKGRWGEEEGGEWQGLKDWAGVRGMVLDKVGLMEGME